MDYLLAEDALDLMDTRSVGGPTVATPIPSRITGSYDQDYNIFHIDDVIRTKLSQLSLTRLPELQRQLRLLEREKGRPQSRLAYNRLEGKITAIRREITAIETGGPLRQYQEEAAPYLQQYRERTGKVRTVVFSLEPDPESSQDLDWETRERIAVIDRYLEVAMRYHSVEVVRNPSRPRDLCQGCGLSLSKVAVDQEGNQCCPDCQTVHTVLVTTKCTKDNARLSGSGPSEDESIDNFLLSFLRYQGLQPERPDPVLFEELDRHFTQHGRPTGAEIRALPLNEHGRRGDTNHCMLWDALAQVGYSDHYKDANLIGHQYWGWVLPDVMQYRDTIVDHYHKTQRVFHQIPPEERGRNSSLGTQYRLWRHLQLVGHPCSMEEFKIAENGESLRTHNRLWRLMCEGANDAHIYYIP